MDMFSLVSGFFSTAGLFRVISLWVGEGKEEGGKAGRMRVETELPRFDPADTRIVDGGAWRMGIANPGAGFKYPDFLLSDELVTGVAGGKKAKL